MQEKDNHFQSLGICHKFFNFIMNTIIARGLKRITLGRPVSRGYTEVPIEVDDPSRNGGHPVKPTKHIGEERVLHPTRGKSEGKSGSEIKVELKQPNGLENWTPVDELGFSVHVLKKDNPIVNGNQTQLQKGAEIPSTPSGTAPMKEQVPEHKFMEERNKEKDKEQATGSGSEPPPHDKELPLVQKIGVSNSTSPSQAKGKNVTQVQGKGSPDVEFPSTTVAQARGSKKSLSIKESTEEKEKNKKKGKNIVTEKPTPVRDPEDMKMTRGSNINEKSDAFIRSRKEAMRRNYTTEPRTS